ncbi:MAG: hypothetical protein OK455_07700 [Thaumarchaeota archaeon]|nr:hypothetical protein [Nitrososphaerota archaeon]
MVYTTNSDIYVAVHENGINDLISRLMLEVPSFFNFGSRYVATYPQLACNPIKANPIDPEDPLISPIDISGIPPLLFSTSFSPFPSENPPIGTPVPFNLNIPIPSPDFIVQLSQLQIDFSSGNAIALPSTVTSPLPAQHFAIHAQTFAGATCPSGKRKPIVVGNTQLASRAKQVEERIGQTMERHIPGISNIPAPHLDCFELDLFAEGVLKNPGSSRFLNMNLDSLDIVGFGPDGLRELIDCYLMYFTNGVLFSVSNAVNALLAETLNLESLLDYNPATFTLQVTPSASVPNNPAIENDQVKLFMDANVTLSGEVFGPPGGGGSGGPGYGPPTSRSVVPRPGAGPTDFTIAISQNIIDKIMATVFAPGSIEIEVPVGPPPPASQPYATYGNPPLYIDYKVALSLAGGSVKLQNPNSTQPNGSILIKDLTVSWDTLKFKVNIDLPKIGIPGFSTPALVIDGVTIIPAVNIPGFSLFGGNGHNPDISIPIDLSGLESQVSITLEPVIYYVVGNAVVSNDPNRWEFYVVPQLPIFVVPVEFGPKLQKAIEDGIAAALADVLDPFPGPLQDIIKGILTTALEAIGGAISTILSDVSSLAETIVDMITNANLLGLTSLLDNALLSLFSSSSPLFTIRDPYLVSQPNTTGTQVISVANPRVTITPGPPTINLQIPIPYIGVNINASEVVVEADIGP